MYLRNTMIQSRLNTRMLASLYKNLTNSMDVTEITRSFISKVEDIEKFFRKL